MLLAIRVPDDNPRGPQYVRQLLDVLHQANRRRLPVTLLFGRLANEVGVFCRVPGPLESVVSTGLQGLYAGCTAEPLAEDAIAEPVGQSMWTLRLHLIPDAMPLHVEADFADIYANRAFIDPITGVLSQIAACPLWVEVALTIVPASKRVRRRAQQRAAFLESPLAERHHAIVERLVHLASRPQGLRRLIASLAIRLLVGRTPFVREEKLRTQCLFEVVFKIRAAAPWHERKSALRRLRALSGAFSALTRPPLVGWHVSRLRSWHRRDRGFLLSSQELAMLWHPVTAGVEAPHVLRADSRQLEPPIQLARSIDKSAIRLGVTHFHNQRDPVWIDTVDRLRHVLVIGRTGSGKSTLASNAFAADLLAGRGCCLIDPHGDLAEHAITLVPRHRTNAAIVFDCGDRRHPVGFNPLRCDDPAQRPLVADGVLSAFKHVFGITEAEAPRLTFILRCALLTLLESPGTTLIDLDRLLGDVVFQRRLVERVDDPVVRAFWINQFFRWSEKEKREAVASVVNKVGHFTTNPLTRAILCQADAKLDLRQAMDEGAPIIVNLSKGRLGEASANLLGALFVSSLQLAAMSRADLPPDKRRPFFVVIDEFQNVAARGTIETLLSEARKFGLGLTCLHQNLEQLSEEVVAAVLANTGSLISFAVGSRDAEPLAEQFAGKVTPQDLIRLPQFHCYVRLLIDGQPSRPFSMTTLPPPAHGSPEVAATVRRVSQRRFSQPLPKVEAAIAKAYGAF